MTPFWPHWLRPLWLLLLPLLGGLLWQLWHLRRRSGRWQSLLPPAFHGVLLDGGSRRTRLPWIALGLAWLLALLALLGPSWRQLQQPGMQRGDPLVVLLQLSPQMLAADVAPNRLERARHKLLDLLEARREAQTAIVVYAGSAHTVVPLSDDQATLRNLLDALKPSIMPSPGQRADLAVAKGLQLLHNAGQGRGRLLLVTCGLSERERDGMRGVLRGSGVRLAILGVGSVQGAPVPLEQGDFLRDAQGAIVFSRLDAAGLQHTAGELGGLYAQARPDAGDLRALQLLGDAGQLRETRQVTPLARWADQGHWFLLPLLLIAACAGRRGWLLCLPLLLALPQAAQAFEFEDLWLRPDQQGQRLLEQQRPAEAASRFADFRWQAHALYQAGDYAGAAQRFAQGHTAADHYNRGNALAKGGELEAALEAYAAALALQPGLTAAQTNKALVEEALRQRRERQAQGQQTPPPEAAGDAPPSGPAGSAAGNPAGPRDPMPATAPQPAAAAAPAPAPGAAQSDTGLPATGVPATGVPATGLPAPAGPPGDPSARPAQAMGPLEPERRQALDQWLRQIPDDPAELLRRKFWYEQQRHPETLP